MYKAIYVYDTTEHYPFNFVHFFSTIEAAKQFIKENNDNNLVVRVEEW